MKKIILSLVILSISLFATCTTTYQQLTYYGGSCSSLVGKFYDGPNSIRTSASPDYVNKLVVSIVSETPKAGGGFYCGANTQIVPYVNSTCIYNTSTCTCEAPNCSWATTPPWYKSTRSQSTCNNSNGYGSSSEDSADIYWFNFSWCQADSNCYARKYHCPAGTAYDSTTKTCLAPTKPKPDPKYCPQGFYPTAVKMISSVAGGEVCGQDWICKNNPSIVINREFSCGAGPVDDQFPPTNPDAPIEDDAPFVQDPGDHSTTCGTKKMLAQSACQSPNILSFSCDPRTGQVTKQECKTPTLPNDKDINPEDSTAGATTADIKDLSNTLPKSIREALSDFFTDGSMPHLESIKGSLESSLHLQADTVTAVNNVENSINAGLSLQSDANSKLDGIKNAIDNIAPSEEGNGVNPSDYITDSDLVPDSTIGTTIEGLSDDLESIQDQFVNAKNIVSGNFTPPSFSGGSCPTLTGPAGISVNPAQIGAVLSPYAPIISILVYISIMFITFGSVFKFLSRGLK